MNICISGTPGTGKTELSKKLAKELSFKYIDANLIINKHKLKEEYDKKHDSFIVDVKKLEKYTKNEIKKIKSSEKIQNFIIDSHMSHHFSNSFINVVVVCICELKELKKRLKKRQYSPSKIKENLEVEIFETCLIESQENNHNNILIYDNKNFNEILKKIKTLQSKFK